jgi:hypothetical protein
MELHLYEDIRQQVQSGRNEREAFEISVQNLVLNGVNNVTYNIAYFLAVGMLAGTSLCRVKAHI